MSKISEAVPTYRVLALSDGTFEVILEEGALRFGVTFESQPEAERFIERRKAEAGGER